MSKALEFSPSLLDRLTDNDPGKVKESAAASIISANKMRDILKRDIAWILATIRMEEINPVDGCQEVRRSVLNYGIKDLSGVPEQNLDPIEVQNSIRQALWDFEPRLEPTSIDVELVPHVEGDIRGVAKLKIAGRWTDDLYRDPIFLEAKINFETGSVMGKEFAQSHPKIASRLDLTSMSPQDPYVERLLEGFAFLTARIRLRMDAQYPEFTQNLLGLLYPNLVAPTPSCGVFEFQPDFKEGALIDGFTIPRGTSMITRPESTDTACEFLTTSDIILRPLVVDEAEYTDQPSLIQKWLPDTPKLEAAIRLRIRIATDAPMESLSLDPLSFFISGDGAQPDRILQSLVMDASKIVAHPVDPDYTPNTSNPLTIRHDGFSNEEHLLPYSAKTFSGHRLLQEAFILMEKFRFVSILGLETALKEQDCRVFDIVFGLTKAIPEFETSIVPEAFRLHCVPAINLFERRADRISVTAGQSEHIVIVDRTRPQGYEVYDVLGIDGLTDKNAKRLKFEPIFQPEQQEDNRKTNGYFNTRRSNRLISSSSMDTAYRSPNTAARAFSAG